MESNTPFGVNDGGAAFPVATAIDCWPGMSLREYYAGLAMQGMLAKEGAFYSDPEDYDFHKFAVQMADLLIAELSKPKP